MIHYGQESKRGERGFTLIELLVVIIILGVLSAVVVFAVRGTGDKGKASAVTTDEKTIRTAEEAYCAQKGTYASGRQLVDGGFLSNLPEYHQVNAQSSGGSCNGWKFFINKTAQADAYPAGSWKSVESPPIYVIAMTRMLDGRVFAIGTNNDFDAPASAIWDPATGLWTLAAPHPETNLDHIAPSIILLSDDPGTPTSECKLDAVDNCGKVLYREKFLYNPANNQWETLSPPADCFLCSPATFAYENRTMVQIKGLPAKCGTACGKILMTGNVTGFPPGPEPPPGGLLFDPKTSSYTTVPFVEPENDGIKRSSYSTQLPDGRVFICCGDQVNPDFRQSNFFDPLDLKFKPGPIPPDNYSRNGGVYDPEPTPLLPNGDLLFAKNSGPGDGRSVVYTPQAGGAGLFRPVATCRQPDTGGDCMALGSLPDGRVLARAGDRRTVTSFVYNPGSERWDPAPDLNNGRSGYGGGVLLSPAGGPCGTNCGKMFLAGYLSAELYTP